MSGGGAGDDAGAGDAAGDARAGSVNYGNSGAGAINAVNIAIGPNSRIDAGVQQAQLRPQLDALAAAVERFHGPEQTRTQLTAAHEQLLCELTLPQPHKQNVLNRLAVIASAAGSASAIAGAAEAISAAVQHLL